MLFRSYEATAELFRRGYQAIHLDLAKMLSHPDPTKRRALVDALPRMAGVDARPWLIWLANDSDSAVRNAALSIMATTRDPQLHGVVRQSRSAEPKQSRPR